MSVKSNLDDVPAKKTKIFILGTSNSVSKNGWVDGFTEYSNFAIEKIVLGGSPFTQFLGYFSKIVEASPDIIIVESSPNDEAHFGSIGSEFMFLSLYNDFISYLSGIAKVVIFRIPTSLSMEHPHLITEKQFTLARQYGALIVDAADMLKEVFLEHPSQDGSIFRDKYHPHTYLSRLVGKNLFQTIEESYKKPRRRSWRQRNFMNNAMPPNGSRKKILFEQIQNYFPYKHVVIGVNNYQQSIIETSVYSGSFCVISSGQAFNFDKTFFCLGFFVNAGITACIITVHGPLGERSIYCDYASPRNNNIVKFVPIKDGFYMHSISVGHPHLSIETGLDSEFMSDKVYQIAIGPLLEYGAIAQ